MSLRSRSKLSRNKKFQARAAEGGYSVGSLSLWYGTGVVEFNGKLTFGDYKSPDAVTYNLALFKSNYDDAKYLYQGNVTIPIAGNRIKGRSAKKRQKEPVVGKVRLYEGKGDSYYLLIWMSEFDESGKFNYEEAELYNCPLVESKSNKSTSPVLFGRVYESSIGRDRGEDKVEKAKQLLRKDKADSWYGPEDIAEIIDTYSEEQVIELVYRLSEMWGNQYNHQFILRVADNNSNESDNEFEYVDEEDDESSDEFTEEDDNELDYEEEDREEEEETDEDYDDDDDEEQDLPQLKLNLGNRDKRNRIADVARKGRVSKKTMKRNPSDYLEGLEDSDAEELL